MNFKKLNLGLVALLLGFGLVITQSAFTTKKFSQTWYYDQNTSTWVTEGSIVVPDGQKLVCSDPEIDYCKALFMDGATPNSPLAPSDHPEFLGEYDRGVYEIVPE